MSSLRAVSLPSGCQHGHGCGSGVGDRHHLHAAAEEIPLEGMGLRYGIHELQGTEPMAARLPVDL